MKKIFIWKLLLSLILLPLMSVSASAATYFVDPVNGSDDPRRPNGGSSASPFKTISRAVSVAVRGDKIALLPGVFSHSSGERFPLFARDGVKITPAQSTYISNGVMRSVISGRKPDGTNYSQAFEVWGDDLTVEKVEISGFSLPFHVEASGVLRLNVVAFFNNSKGAFQAINGGDVYINDITIGGNTGGFYVGTGATVSANTIHVHDSATKGIEVSGTRANLSVTNLRQRGAPNLTLLKVHDGGHASLKDLNISATDKCVSPCTEKSAIKIYDGATLSMDGGQLQWNRPGFALYSEINTDIRYANGAGVAKTLLIERTFKNDSSGKGVISLGSYFVSRHAPSNNIQNIPLLEIKHPDGVGLELRHNQATANLDDVLFTSAGGSSILLGKDAKFMGYDLRFGNSKGTHFVITEHTSTSHSAQVGGSSFSANATRAVEIKKCSSASSAVDFQGNTWKKNTQGSNANGRYPINTQVKGPTSGGNHTIASNCKANIGS